MGKGGAKSYMSINKFVVSAECIIRDKNKKILSIIRPQNKHAGGLLSFPGGGYEREDSESNHDCLKNIVTREVFEEVGIKINDELKYTFSSIIKDDMNHNNVMHVVFICDIVHTSLKLKVDKNEVPEHFWLTKEEILSHQCCPNWIKGYMELI